MSYVGSAKKRPKQADRGGRGTYCCVPECKSLSHDRARNKTGIGYFKLPTEDPKLWKEWANILKQIRKDKFNITKTTVFCEFHFKQEEIKVSRGIGRKTLIRGAVPSIFTFKANSPKTYVNLQRIEVLRTS